MLGWRCGLASAAIASTLAACGTAPAKAIKGATPPQATATAGNTVGLSVTSSDATGGRWLSAVTCDGGENVPDLHWTTGPSGTASYALQFFDTDAPQGGFTHWMLANESPDARAPVPGTGVSGRNDFGNEGYGAPCPPPGHTHRYVFTIYALDQMLSLKPLYSHGELQQALQGHVLAQADLSASYSR